MCHRFVTKTLHLTFDIGTLFNRYIFIINNTTINDKLFVHLVDIRSVKIYLKVARRNRQRMLKSRRRDSEKKRSNTLKND